jgi:hypothetical protein
MGLFASLILLAALKPPNIFPSSAFTSMRENWRTFRTHPVNYTENFEFFDRVKQLDGPTLILTSYCWGTVIPAFYLNTNFGRRQKPPLVEVYETAGCQHSPAEVRSKIDAFLERNRTTGYVVFFYELTGRRSGGCGEPWQPIFDQPRGEGSCTAIYKASDVGHISEIGSTLGSGR